MTTLKDPTRHTLADLAIGSSDALAIMFTELRARLKRELAEAISSGGWDKLREEWIGTNDSVKSRIIENWLRNGPIAFKPYVIRDLKNLIDEVFILSIVTRPLDQLRATTAEHASKLFQILRVQFDQELNEC